MNFKTIIKKELTIISKNFSIFNVAKLLLIIVSISSLILSSSYIQAILKLENEICGFLMFIFVLMSVMVLFQSVRMKKEKVLSLVANMVIIVITIIIGYQLYKIYNDAFVVQKKLNNPEVVKYAIRLIRNELITYVIGIILLIVQTVKTLRLR
ncbi:MAG: hypothetical protein WC162_07130 [Sphaerochaetaceae bacterium]